MFENRIAKVKQGMVQGEKGRDQSITVFRGIPYAQPPVGKNRWKAPQPPISWLGVRKAVENGPLPVQVKGSFFTDRPFEEIYQSEDCLYLTVWTGVRDVSDKLPVLVWFHGGGFQGGCSFENMFDGENFAKQGIIVVSVSYRVGLMGFFVHPDMTKENENVAAGNFGLQDLAAAVAWVRENIGAFGGNPEKITVAGQSAGGASVSYLMCNPVSRDLIAGAICESGDPFIGLMGDYDQAMADGTAVCKHLGCETLDDLRKIPVKDLVAGDTDIALKVNGRMCLPVVDGVTLPEDPCRMVLAGKCSHVPMIMGSTSEEALPGDYDSFLQWSLSSGEMFSWYYPKEEYGQSEGFEKLSNAFMYGRMHAWAKMRSQSLGLPSWQYVFVRAAEVFGIRKAMHSAELADVFGSFELVKDLMHMNYDEDDQELSRIMSAYWANFVKYGNPNGEGLLPWPEISEGKGYMSLEIPCYIQGEDTYPDYVKAGRICEKVFEEILKK